ncbi:hypothetical protein F5051DRAFT_447503 [Lentinula edodes]|nr:hypothetical protein F5051DRAFT_447503 [Lentinula edodes]
MESYPPLPPPAIHSQSQAISARLSARRWWWLASGAAIAFGLAVSMTFAGYHSNPLSVSIIGMFIAAVSLMCDVNHCLGESSIPTMWANSQTDKESITKCDGCIECVGDIVEQMVSDEAKDVPQLSSGNTENSP